MSSRIRSERPNLDELLVRRWPTPPGVRRSVWSSMSPTAREAWLIDHTYESTPDGWVVRPDHADSKTTEMVEEALAASEATYDVLVEPIVEDLDRTFTRTSATGIPQRSHAFLLGLILVLIAITAVVLWAFAADLFGDDDSSDPAVGTATTQAAGDAEPTPSTPGDGDDAASDDRSSVAEPDVEENTEPVALTDGPWRFFLTSAEAQPLYDFAFAADGTFIEDGAPHNHGTYVVDGSTITLDLTRVHTVTASDGSEERSEEVTWSETFTMTRTGNTMTGTWRADDWIYSFDNGFVLRGEREAQTAIFARPETPEDAG